MRRNVLAMLTIAATVAFSSTASARDFAQIYVECGLGAMIAPSNDAVAVVTNVTWDLGTTAISSNASSPDTCQGGKAKTAAYIMETYPELEKDLAQGNGAHLAALMTVSGCSQAVQPELTAALRKDFAGAVAQADYGSKDRAARADVLYTLMDKRIESDFAGSCVI